MSLDDLSLFTPRLSGSELRDRGMALVDEAEPDAWKAKADAAIRSLAASGAEFGAEEVRAIAGSPEHPNAFGSRFLQAAKRGLIRKVGYRNSSRPSLHAHPVAVWVGNLKQPEGE